MFITLNKTSNIKFLVLRCLHNRMKLKVEVKCVIKKLKLNKVNDKNIMAFQAIKRTLNRKHSKVRPKFQLNSNFMLE